MERREGVEEWFHYHGLDYGILPPDKGESEQVVRNVMLTRSGCNTFSDLAFFNKCTEGVKLKIHSIQVWVDNYGVHSLQVWYRATEANGFYTLLKAQKHTFGSRRNAVAEGKPDYSLVMENGEYVCGMSLYRAPKWIKRLKIITNLHLFDIGIGHHCDRSATCPERDLSKEVHTLCGAGTKIGYTYKKSSWKAIRPFVILRTILDRGRGEEREGGPSLIQRVMNLDDDCFRIVMSFLGTNPKRDMIDASKFRPDLYGFYGDAYDSDEESEYEYENRKENDNIGWELVAPYMG